jgi:hypothetical protein
VTLAAGAYLHLGGKTIGHTHDPVMGHMVILILDGLGGWIVYIMRNPRARNKPRSYVRIFFNFSQKNDVYCVSAVSALARVY